MIGVVRYNLVSGHFGKIFADGRLIFFHFGDLTGIEGPDLAAGAWVEFDLVDDRRGPRALNVRPYVTSAAS